MLLYPNQNISYQNFITSWYYLVSFTRRTSFKSSLLIVVTYKYQIIKKNQTYVIYIIIKNLVNFFVLINLVYISTTLGNTNKYLQDMRKHALKLVNHVVQFIGIFCIINLVYIYPLLWATQINISRTWGSMH